jgi:glycosyltransferase involved in cell wall biosynthesis
MRVSLIIATYNWPESLILALRSIEKQTIAPEEVVIADDGSTAETKEIIDKFQKDSDLNIIHSWQEDNGFRVAKSRNKAIAKSCGNYIILIDGDIILHPKFVQDHVNNAKVGYFMQGSRVLLSQDITEQIIISNRISFSFFSKGMKGRKNSIHSNFLSKIFSTKKNYLRGIKTCNIAFFRQDFINVNGFNNEFEGWGREDSEFVVRLFNTGINRKNLRFNAIQYHLWHKDNDRKHLDYNNQLLQNSINQKLKVCKKGINKYI